MWIDSIIIYYIITFEKNVHGNKTFDFLIVLSQQKKKNKNKSFQCNQKKILWAAYFDHILEVPLIMNQWKIVG